MTLLLGGSGQLGTAFRRLLPEANAPTHDQFDLLDIKGISARVGSLRPDSIVNCAAYTAVDAAEDDEETANRLNGEAVRELAGVAHQLGIPFVTFSTDYVFDGETDRPYTEMSEPNPINAYGRSKLSGEQAALQYPGSLVVRTSWLFSATHPNFVGTTLAKAAHGEVQVVNDQWGRPTPVLVLAKATLDAMARGTTGVLHLAGPPPATWFELARSACRAAVIDPGRIRPCRSEDFPLPARRPRHSVLETTSGIELPSWHGELTRIAREIRHRDERTSPLP